MQKNIDKQAENVVKLLCKYHKKAATAESCTGGLISSAITSVSGSSEVFDMGICSYANRIKSEKINVSKKSLEQYGAVSEQVAMEMAEGVMISADSDYGVSTTGIAGPTGGTAQKPVGTVCIGICSKGNPPKAQRFLFEAKDCPDNLTKREYIRMQAVLKALEVLEKEIKTENK